MPKVHGKYYYCFPVAKLSPRSLIETPMGIRIADQRARSRIPSLKLEWMDKKYSYDTNKSTQADYLPSLKITVMITCPSSPLPKSLCSSLGKTSPLWPLISPSTSFYNIINSTIITSLDGFHLLLSYNSILSDINYYTGFLELLQLLYPGSTTAVYILNYGHYLLIDKAIYQCIINHACSGEELHQKGIHW